MTLPRMLLHLLLLFLALAPALPGGPALAQAPRAAGEAGAPALARPSLTPADFERLGSLLQDEARRAEFLRMLEALAVASRAQSGVAAEGTLPPAPEAGAPTAPPPPSRPVVAAAAESGDEAAHAPEAPRAATPAVPAPAAAATPTPVAAPAAPAAAPPAPAATAASPAAPAAPPAAATPPAAAPPAAPAAAPPAAAPPAEPAAPSGVEALIAPNTIGAQLLLTLQGRIGVVTDAMFDAVRAMADIPALWHALVGMAEDRVTRARVLDAAWKLLLLLGLGLSLEWLLWRSLVPLRRRVLAAAPAPEPPIVAPAPPPRPALSDEEREALDDGSEAHAERAMPPPAPPPPGAPGPVRRWLKRLPLAAARLLLDALPIAAFAVAVYGLIGVVRPLPTTQLAGLLIAHVYIGARMAFVLVRVLLAPGAPGLRLVPLPDSAAAYGVVWLRRMLLVGLGGYVLAEVGVSFGLSWTAYDTIVNLTLLLISLMLVRIIIQQRHTVADALRARPPAAGETIDAPRRALRRARNRLAEVWHLIAILWLLALWMVSSLAVEDGMQRLFTASALTLLVGATARVLDEVLRRAIERAINPGEETERRWPGLAVRAATYGPALRAIVTVAVAAGGLVLLLEVWGVNAIAWFAAGTLGARLLDTLLSIGLTLVLALLFWEAASSAIQRRLARLSGDGQASRSARVRTLLPMLRAFLGIFILVFALLSVVSQLGVNVAPLLAGAGVIGVAIGFGSQTLVRDVITGIFLLLEDTVAVGDVVTLGGLSGVVEHLSIRSIKLRALDGSVHIIPFSAVTTVTNMTRDFSFAVLDLSIGYGEDPDHVGEVLKEISREMRAEPKWQALMRDDIEVMGVERFGDSGVTLRARAKTEPAARWSVMREFNRRIKRRFDELGIEIPYPYQRVISDRPEVQAPRQPRAAE